jgi:hypothetical protein
MLPGRVHHVDVDGQPWHVANKQIDGRATFHRKDVVGEHVGRDGQ